MRRLSAGLAHASLPRCAAAGAVTVVAPSSALAAHRAPVRCRTHSASSSSPPADPAAAADSAASAESRTGHRKSRADAATEQGFLDRLRTLYRDFQLYRDRQLDQEAAAEAQIGLDRFYDDNDGAPLASASAAAAADASSGGVKRADSRHRRRSPLISRNPNICPRSVLFVPGSKPRALAKIPSLPADCFMLDLEDSVGVASKRQARENVRAFVEELQATHRQRRAAAAAAAAARAGSESVTGEAEAADADDDDYPRLVVRINSPDYDPATAMLDLQLVGQLGPAIEGIALPKTTVRTYQLIKDYVYPEHQLWAFFETPRSVMQAPLICKQQVYQYAVMGYNDLSAELQLPMQEPPATLLGAPDGAAVSEAVRESLHIASRLPLWQSTVQVLQAARAHHMFVIDAVFNDPTDRAGFRRNLQECRLLGLNGKTLIHPGQVELTNAAFMPSAAEVVAAQRIVEAVQRAEGGVATVDGKMVEELHQRQARRVLDLQHNAELEAARMAHRKSQQERQPQPQRSAEATAEEPVSKDAEGGGDAGAAAGEAPSRSPRRTPSRHRPAN